jgi:protein-disulfide isomerase
LSRFFDETIVDKTRSDVYKELVSLATSSLKSSATITEEGILSLLHIGAVQDAEQSTNKGNKVTNDLKYFIKLGRQNGIHVSPTAVWDGVVENSISSGWSLDDWKKFVQSKL